MRLLSGNKKNFLEFLNSITEKDRVAVVSHIDLDGIVSAILIHELLKNNGIEEEVIDFVNLGIGMFPKLANELSKKRINKVYLLDLSESSDYEGFELFREKFETFLVDHHPSSSSGKNIIKAESTDCAAFVLYQLGKEIINLDKWKELVCATMIMEFSYTRDENFEFIKRIYPYITKKDIYNSVPGELSADISSALTYLKGDVKKVYDLILRGNMEELREYRVIIDEETKKYTNKYIKEAEFFPEKNLYFYYTTPELDVSSAVATILSLREKDKTFIFVSDIKGEKGYVKVSSRNQSGNVDLNSLLKKGIERLENATAGGHAKASGARFMKRDIDKFKENLLK